MSLLPESFDYTIITVLNPHRPPEPQAVPEPERPEDSWTWEDLSKEEREQARREYAAALELWREYERAHAAWQAAPETLAAADALTVTVRDLEQRGLLQYERQTGRWDLHPVVRAVSSSRLGDDNRDHLGQQIIDYFSQRHRNPYEQAETLDDFRDAITVVRTLVQLGRTSEACNTFDRDLVEGLLFNVEAYPEFLSLARPFFTHGWSVPSKELSDYNIKWLATGVAYALHGLAEFKESVEVMHVDIRACIAAEDWQRACLRLFNISELSRDLNRLALSDRYSILGLALAEALDIPEEIFSARLGRFETLAVTGRWDEAEEMWNLLDPMGRNWSRRSFRSGDPERIRLEAMLFPTGCLTERDLTAAERMGRTGHNRNLTRRLQRLRGKWQLACGEHTRAVASLQDAIRMAHEAGFTDPESETLLTLARFHLNQIPAAREDALRLSAGRDPAHLPLAVLWRSLGDIENAAKHAEAAYRHAWGDGEPYVRKYNLDSAKILLQQLDKDIPTLPAYDPAQDPKKPWENEIAVAITKTLNRKRKNLYS